MMLLASLLAPLLVRLPSGLLILLAVGALVLPQVWRSPAFDGIGWGFHDFIADVVGRLEKEVGTP